MNIQEADYFKIIRSKTAALIAACTACGAISVTDNPEIIASMKQMGEEIGIAFQIKDDILDYEGNSLTGKLKGNDIKERKITLPLIYALENSSFLTRRKILHIVRKRNKTNEETGQVIKFVQENRGIEYALEKMNHYRDRALAHLQSYPPSDVRNSLSEFVRYTVSRES
ncbi:MAG TPA: polyprenyl synthetase family protein, partial [Bacteroidales bacterium]|nr:polyprenyl synthetase family protein [Bacteroidales bacterium]